MDKHNDFETVYVNKAKMVCYGNDEKLGHPKIYIAIDIKKGEAICPYCSKKFVLKK